jgi:hypothetical protein
VIKIKYFIITLILLSSAAAYAQKGEYIIDDRSNWQDRVYFGGGFGLSGGNGGGLISLSPLIGYMLTPKLSGGVGATYQYYKFGDFTDNRYGGQFFLRMNTFRTVFLYASYEFFNYSTGYNFEGPRRTVTRFPIGAGISQPIGPRSSLNFLAAYDVLWDQTAYTSPWVFSVFFSI